MSPGTGTEMSPGALRAGTEMSPGTGTEMSPGALRAGTEMSPGTGTEMSPGAIFRSGTEMSPGTGTEMSPGAIFRSGTEMSPGTGTEMSPGAAFWRDRVVLTRLAARTSRRTDALFRAMSTDHLLREQFVTDPAQVMSEYLFGKRLNEQHADAANQLLYSVLSNQRLRDWMARYARHLKGAMPSRHQFAIELARALAASGDGLSVLGLVRAASDGAGVFVLQTDLLRSLVGVLAGWSRASGTEMSPGGTGTEMSPGTGTEMSPGAIFSGTEMSPGGTGTEMSPGGTEMSPGRAGGAWQVAAHVLVSLRPLVQYAAALRARNALVSTGLEAL